MELPIDHKVGCLLGEAGRRRKAAPIGDSSCLHSTSTTGAIVAWMSADDAASHKNANLLDQIPPDFSTFSANFTPLNFPPASNWVTRWTSDPPSTESVGWI